MSTIPCRILALDVGGTKLAATVMDVRAFESAHAARAALEDIGRTATRANATSEDLFGDVCELLDPLVASGSPVDAVGVGIGGPMSPHGELVSPLNISAWREFPLRARLSERYGVPVAVDNDAKALALAEGRWGAAAGQRDFLAMVVSTGVGGGIVLDGRLLDGAGGNAGHIGHMIVEPNGAVCGCGARGCLEAEASGSGIERTSGRPAAEASAELRQRTGQLVGRAVASVATLLDLPLAVVAGSVALGFGADFFDAAQTEIDRCAQLDFARGTRIIPGGLHADGPLLGAVAVGIRALES